VATVLLNQMPQASIDMLKAYADELGVPPAEVVTRLLAVYSQLRMDAEPSVRELLVRAGLPA